MPPLDPSFGLCARCRHASAITSGRGSTFLFCLRSKVDRSYPKYPPLPVFACAGFDAGDASDVAEPPDEPRPREPEGA